MPPGMPSTMEYTYTMANNPPELLGYFGTAYVRLLYDIERMRQDNHTGCYSHHVFTVAAFLYNRSISDWDHTNQPHTLARYTPDDFQIPKTHPKYAEIQKMQSPPGPPINT
jgi:hypothetical protein